MEKEIKAMFVKYLEGKGDKFILSLVGNGILYSK